MKRLILFVLAFLFCFYSNDSFSQENTTDVSSANFFTLQEEANSFFKENPKAKGFKQWKRQEWFYEPRLYPSGESINIADRNAKAHRKYLKSHSAQRSTHGQWGFIGPYDHINNSGDQGGKGRINSIDFHPTNDQIIYAGTSHGGLWKTENGGVSWLDISPRLPLLAIADVVLDPNNTDHIYIVTGDPNPCNNCYGSNTGHSSIGNPSLGIIRSTDGGITWNPNNLIFESSSNRLIYKLIINPTNSLYQLAATDQGVVYTDDAWATYQEFNIGRTYDIVFKPGDPSQIYASGTSTVSRSTNGGLNWTTMTDSDFPSGNDFTRTRLAVSPDLPAGVYYVITTNTGSTLAIMRSLANGDINSWAVVDGPSTRFGGQGFHNLAMAVRPDKFSHLYVGMVSFGRSTNGGASNSWSVNNLPGHTDVHDIQIRNGVMYCANDGGLYTSLDYGDSWTEISKGIGNTEIYRMSGTPQNSNFYLIGAQDNGTLKKTSSSTTFTSIAGADGMTSMIDYTNANRYIASGQSGFFFKTTSGGTANINITPGDGANWVTPAVMDPVNPNILFIGKDTMYRSNDFGDNWTWFDSPDGVDLNVLVQGTNNRNRLYASRGSQIWQMNTALNASDTTSWTSISAGLPNLFIRDIVVNPTNSFEVFVVLSGFLEGEKVYKSIDAGQEWTNISGTLPNVPVNCIAFHNNGTNKDDLYIGTDIGVFFKNNDLDDWIYFSNSLPSVAITDFYINNANNTIAAATYGRGLWRSDLYSGCVFSFTLTSPTLQGGVKHYSASSTISSTEEHLKDLGTDINYNAGSYIDLSEGFLLGGHAQFLGKADGCPN